MKAALIALLGLAAAWAALAIWQGRQPGEQASKLTPDPYDYSRMTPREQSIWFERPSGRPGFEDSMCTGFGYDAKRHAGYYS